jgi:hypothetical protein
MIVPTRLLFRLRDDPAVRQSLLDIKAEVSRAWTKGTLLHIDGSVCLYGAAALTGIPRGHVRSGPGHGPAEGQSINGRQDPAAECHVEFDLDSPTGVAMLLLAAVAGVHHTELAKWQDAPERTQADVVDLIDKVLAMPDKLRDAMQRIEQRAERDRALQIARASQVPIGLILGPPPLLVDIEKHEPDYSRDERVAMMDDSPGSLKPEVVR